jgi:hypothetical protein
MATVHPDDEYSAALAEVEKKYFKNFPTNLQCVCGSSMIIDHATRSDPNAPPRSIRDATFGPTPAWRERLNAVKVYHSYWCESCGLSYRADVIEKRGYQPLEVREPLPTSHSIAMDRVRKSVEPPHAPSDMANLFRFNIFGRSKEARS